MQIYLIFYRIMAYCCQPPIHLKNDIIGGREQIGFSCPRQHDLLDYITANGKKELEIICSNLDDLGWACYYMDDGSLAGTTENPYIITIDTRGYR